MSNSPHASAAPATPRADDAAERRALRDVSVAARARRRSQEAADEVPRLTESLRFALRRWGRARYGTADRFYVAVAVEADVSVGHVKNALLSHKSGPVIDAALRLAERAEACAGQPARRA